MATSSVVQNFRHDLLLLLGHKKVCKFNINIFFCDPLTVTQICVIKEGFVALITWVRENIHPGSGLINLGFKDVMGAPSHSVLVYSAPLYSVWRLVMQSR